MSLSPYVEASKCTKQLGEHVILDQAELSLLCEPVVGELSCEVRLADRYKLGVDLARPFSLLLMLLEPPDPLFVDQVPDVVLWDLDYLLISQVYVIDCGFRQVCWI